MPTVTTGTQAIDFTYNTPFMQGIKLSDKVKEVDKTFLLFSRYFGCTLCQLDMLEYREAYERFRAKGAQILFVLQSPPETINAAVQDGDYPFEIVCNPDMSLYALYELPAAGSKVQLVSPGILKAIQQKRKKIAEHGLEHGAYEGEELQLPGSFLLDREMNVLYDRRAKNILDKPTIDEMLAML